MGRKIVILYSGGLDSLIMRHMTQTWCPNAEIKCIYYSHGAESEAEELSLLPSDVCVRNVDWLDEECTPQPKIDDPLGGSIYIPGRNLVFATLAACQELPDEIWMGTLYDECNDSATDKNYKFRKDTSDLLTYVLSPFKKNVTIRFPFVEQEMTKVDSVRWALNNGVSPDDLMKTVSCWHYNSDTGKACGECKQCFKRFFVMLLNGIREDSYFKSPLEEVGRKFSEYYLTKESPNLDEANVKNMIVRSIDDNLLTEYEKSLLYAPNT